MMKVKVNREKLDLAMAKNCFSAEQLSTLTGVSTVTIARIKNGCQKGRPKTIGKLAKALNVKVEELIED
jgi:DNA-binding Xre family transcriptional regulator